MEARARIFGHPIHQMLIPVPFGLFATAALIDVAGAFFRWQALSVVSFWNIAIGSVTAVIAAIFGAIDWSGIPSGTRAKRVGAIHAIANGGTIALFVAALAIRADEPFFAVPSAALVAEVAALLLVCGAGWLGGELVDKLAIGVDPNAHPDHRRGDRTVVRREIPVGDREEHADEEREEQRGAALASDDPGARASSPRGAQASASILDAVSESDITPPYGSPRARET